MNNDAFNNNSANEQQGQQFGDAAQQAQYSQTQYNQNAYAQNMYYVDESGMFSENKLARKNGTSAAVKIGNWMALDCIGFLNLIPFFGNIAALVIYLVIAFSSKTSYSVKTRVRANFIWTLIIIGFYVILFIVLFSFFADVIAREFSRSSNFYRYF